MAKAVLGVIGGSGVYDLPGLEDVREERIASPWGEPSDALRIGRIGATRDGLPAPPRTRAPLFSLRHQLPRQYRRDEARRRHRPHLRLGLRLLQAGAHPGPFRARRPVRRPHLRARELVLRQGLRRACARWRIRSGRACRSGIAEAAEAEKIPSCAAAPMSAWRGRNSRPMRSRSPTRRSDYDVIGMTNMPEAKLAREAEISYATIAMVTDYDCWHPEHDAVDVAAVDRRRAAQRRQGRTPRRPRRAGFPGRARAVPGEARTGRSTGRS